MSVQTGTPSLVPPPPSSRRLVRAAHQVQALRNDPNPVWMRELRQAARLSRTPIILAVVSGLVTLLMCSIGGIASGSTEPAKVGTALYQTFFSVAFAVVTWVAPAVAAATIASERGGRTWEALQLTGLGAETIARGKFLAAFTYIALYIAMLAPVGALPFLFGGVTASEVLLAFVLLLLFGVLSVAVGLSLSSKFSSAATAIVVSLLGGIPVSILVYLCLGVWLSVGIHEIWPTVPEALPVWLPTALVRADFGLEYVVLLVVAPIALTFVPAWFLYVTTVANMASPSDDRSTGVRIWFAVSAPLLAAVCVAVCGVAPKAHFVAAAFAAGIYACFLAFGCFVFAGEPLGPSRRVQVEWARRGVGRMRRYFGPGLLRACSLLMLIGLVGLALIAAGGVGFELIEGGPDARRDALRVVIWCAYAAAFFVFLVGFTSWARARAQSAVSARFQLLGVLFVALAGPWIVMAVAGVATSGDDSAIVVAAPSPVFAGVMMDVLDSTRAHREAALAAGSFCIFGWTVIGLALLGAAKLRASRVIAEHQRSLEQLEQALAAEDAADRAAHDAAHQEPAAVGA